MRAWWRSTTATSSSSLLLLATGMMHAQLTAALQLSRIESLDADRQAIH